MGRVRCSKHGSSPFDVTCSHAGEQIDNGEFPTGHQFTLIQRLFVCNECVKLLDFEKYRRLHEEGAPDPSDPSWDAYFEAWTAADEALKDNRYFCSKCIDQLERKRKSQ